jgi:predicted peptidase
MTYTTRILTTTFAGALFATTASAAQDLTFTYSDPVLGTMPYHVFLPDSFNSAPSGSIPIILYMHGAGERGNNNTDQLNYIKVPGSLLDKTQSGNHQAIVIAPQVYWNQQWVDIDWTTGAYHNNQQPAISKSMQMAMNILGQVQSNYTQDNPNRVYVTGMSMGGYGAFDAIQRFPNTFAAAMPLSGGGNVDQAYKLADRGIWAWHGALDDAVPVSGSDGMIDAIRAAGGNPIYNRVPNLGHAEWHHFYMELYSGPGGVQVYDWLFSQSLVPEPATGTLLLGAGSLLLRRRRGSFSL